MFEYHNFSPIILLPIDTVIFIAPLEIKTFHILREYILQQNNRTKIYIDSRADGDCSTSNEMKQTLERVIFYIDDFIVNKMKHLRPILVPETNF